MTLSEALQKLEGAVLTAVEFVEDYVQLRFDNTTLNVYNRPVLFIEPSQGLTWDDPDFARQLLAIAGNRLLRAVLSDDSIELIFSPKGNLLLSIREDDYLGPEALELLSPDGWFVI